MTCIKKIKCYFDNMKNKKKNNVIVNSEILKNKYFLIVDDNKINIKIIKKFLELLNIKKKHIFCAENGIVALNMCEQNIFDVIISDIEMPMCDGFQLENLLRKSKINKNNDVPIIFMTASNDQFILNKIKINDNPYLLKPINKNKLHALLIESIINNEIKSFDNKNIFFGV